MDQLGPKIDEISLKIVLLFQKYRFFYWNLFSRT